MYNVTALDRYDIHGKLVNFMAPIEKGTMVDSSRFVQRFALNFYVGHLIITVNLKLFILVFLLPATIYSFNL